MEYLQIPMKHYIPQLKLGGYVAQKKRTREMQNMIECRAGSPPIFSTKGGLSFTLAQRILEN
jgi:hypothetical protein